MNTSEKAYVGCPVQYVRLFIAGKWQMGILWNLQNQPLRFSEIKNLLPGISDKTLMQELDFFVHEKVVERKTYRFPSPRVEYKLSGKGRSLIPVISTIVEWGYCYLQDQKADKKMSLTPSSVIESIENRMAEIE